MINEKTRLMQGLPRFSEMNFQEKFSSVLVGMFLVLPLEPSGTAVALLLQVDLRLVAVPCDSSLIFLCLH